jgi:hypothetical protein
VPWHADNGDLKRRWCSAVSSGGRGGSSLKRDGGGAWRRQGVRGGRGDEAPLLEAVEALTLLLLPRRPHCSNCATVETLPLLDGGPRRSGNSVYLDRRQRAGPDLGPTCPDLGSDFFLFLKTDFGYRLGIADTKNNLFFVS